MSKCECNGWGSTRRQVCLPGPPAAWTERGSVDKECQCCSWEGWCKRGRSHWSTGMTAAPVLQHEKLPRVCVCVWCVVACPPTPDHPTHTPEQSDMQASARPRSVSPHPPPSSRCLAPNPVYLLQWVDQEPILFVAHIGISASNLRSTDSSEASFLFEQTDLCFSLWQFVRHTNWLRLPPPPLLPTPPSPPAPAAAVFSGERLCPNLRLGSSALANTFRKKCTYCYRKSCWHNTLKIICSVIVIRSFISLVPPPRNILKQVNTHIRSIDTQYAEAQ